MPSIDTPGALGLDRRNDVQGMDSRRALDMNNLDIFPGDTAEGSRVGARRWLRRWGQRIQSITLSLQAGPGLTGDYTYIYIWTDTAGITHRSYSANTSPAAQKVRVTGWPSEGTVTIYRTVAGPGPTLKVVVAALDAVANAFYDDAIADGSLGSAAPAAALEVDPYRDRTFTQAVFTDQLLLHKDKTDTYRLLTILTGNALYRATPSDASELIYKPTSAGGGSAGAVPLCAALLGDKLWLASTSGLLWAALGPVAAAGAVAASQPAQPTIGSVTQAAGGNVTATVSSKYVVQQEDPNTGVRSIPSAPYSLGVPYAAQKNTVNYTATAGNNVYIYRTTDGGQFFQLVGSMVAGSSYLDNIADSGLSQLTVPFEVGAAPKWRVILAHKGLLFGWNKLDSSDRRSGFMGWTSTLYPHNWPSDPTISTDFTFDIDPNDGDEGMSAYSWGEIIIACKRRRAYMVSGDPPSGFRWAPVPGSKDKGCIAPRTMVEIAIGLVWLSPEGVVLMPAPGAAPLVISEAIRDVMLEPQRLATRRLTSTLTSEPAEITFDYTATAAQTINVRVQLDDDPAFGSINFDYDTENSSERGYFMAGNAPFPAAGYALALGQRARIALRPPTSGGPTAGTLYHARYAIDTGSGWGAWVSAPDFTLPTDDPYPDTLDASKLSDAFAVHYPARHEYWLGIPTGGRRYADTFWVLDYSAAESGNLSGITWRRVTLAASAACFVDNWSIDALPAADYLLFASPDGILYTYPFVRDGIDFDTRVTVAAADRRVPATLSGSTLTASGTSWPTSRYGLAGGVVTARDANGLTYTGLITANTATTLTVVWLSGRNPPAGALTIAVGGVDSFLDIPWMRLGQDEGYTAVIRSIGIRSNSPRTNLYAILRYGEGARQRLSEARAAFTTLPIGAGFDQARRQLARGGHYHQLRIGTINDSELWELQAIELEIEQTASRT